MTWFAPTHYYDMYPLETIAIAKYPNPPKNMPIPAFNNNTEMETMQDVIPHVYLNEQKLTLVNTSYHQHLRQGYYASVSFMDSQFGVILSALREFDLFDNTIVVLVGDHGYHLGISFSYTFALGCWSKYTNFELGTRVPLIVRVPDNHKHEGAKANAIVELVDIFPTLVELAGFDITPQLNAQFEGKSLKSVIYNPYAEPNFHQVAYNQFVRTSSSFGTIMGVGLRTADWRYTEWCNFDFNVSYPIWDKCNYGTELYNHNSTVSNENNYNSFENENLAGDPAYSSVVQQLHQLLEADIVSFHFVKCFCYSQFVSLYLNARTLLQLTESSQNMGTDTPVEVFSSRIRYQSTIQIIAGAIFWTWALVNILQGKGFDTGVISFFTAITAGIIGWFSTLVNEERAKRVSKLYLLATPVGHILITLNYIVGALFDDGGLTFVVYCWTAAFLWFFTGIYFTFVAFRWKRRLNESLAPYDQL
ncbi:hypothetical protein RFI_07028 [Reticulomyxa filosa]|uniref:Sulfatase N-terminal domain-containing protein n=1 Tax=Reticulomyxa filosa TaxID=46433 RepID=X6NXT7_RETFI|nr:hypothetical protein RFI_07028 [Reticulomyxa filosa]|eukprot:ETO30092.1 hypothetical protein RFI_07028 [Reticulomyxa filosa]